MHHSSPASHLSCIQAVMFPSCSASLNPNFLHPSFPVYLQSWASPFLHPTCPASTCPASTCPGSHALYSTYPESLLSSITPVLDPTHCNPPILNPYFLSSLLPWIPPVLHPFCPASLLVGIWYGRFIKYNISKNEANIQTNKKVNDTYPVTPK